MANVSAVSKSSQRRMPRTRSSLLNCVLRDFIDLDVSATPKIYQKPPARKTSQNRKQIDEDREMWTDYPVPLAATEGPPAAGAVYVDCFFYGFWIDQSKAAEYQQLRVVEHQHRR